MSTFADRLRSTIDELGLSQNALAEVLTEHMQRAGALPKDTKRKKYRVYPSVINRWTSGDSLPEGKYMVHLPVVLQRNGHWLLTGEGDPRLPSRSAEGDQYGSGVRYAATKMNQLLESMIASLP
jgi:hypothetical protein